MKSKSKVPVAIAVIVAALIGGLVAGQIQNRGKKNLIPSAEEVAQTDAAATDQVPAGDGISPDTIDTALSETSAPSAVPESAAESRERAAFIEWRRSEAAKLDSTRVNEDFEIAKLTDRIQKLTPTEWKETARNVLDTAGVANERVFSAYLLGQGGFSSEQTESLVQDVLSKPLPPPGAVHSVEETAALREKSLRLVVIDELIQQVKKDASKRGALDRAVRAIEDPGLRALAERRLVEESL